MQLRGTVYLRRRRSRYERLASPPPAHLTQRDRDVIQAVATYRVLRRDHIQALFFPSARTTNASLARLFHHGFLERVPPLLVWGKGDSPIIYTLGAKGRRLLQADMAHPRTLETPKSVSRYFLEHSLAVNTVRIAMTLAAAHAGYPIERWITEAEFRAAPDRIAYTNHAGAPLKRPVLPDAACVLCEPTYTSRLLFEIDMGTEDNQRFVREKVWPGIAYLKSEAYQRRFGFQSGRWLIITTSHQRLLNMKRQIETSVGRAASVFSFTTLEQVNPLSILTASIWLRGGETSPRPLLRPPFV